MESIYSCPLTHSWPLFDRDQRFDLGQDFSCSDTQTLDLPGDEDFLARQGIGLWDCDLSDNSLTWSAGVYDLFGFPKGSLVDRAASVALYSEHSRAAMERLRAYAIKHKRGFTLDVEIAPADGGTRRMRLCAAPVCVEGRAVRLHGFKRDITADRL
ncbi:MAG: hypothetical protein ACSLE1_05810 [Sphingobium sp.]